MHYWAEIIDRYGLNGKVVEDKVDPTFGFMPADWDGKIRMDCSSPYAMARLIGLRDRFDLAIGNDTDADRHGIVTPTGGLMKPNHYLAAAIAYLFDHRPAWEARCGIGKTMVSSAMIDRVAARLGRRLVEVPVGFKWFVDGLFSGALGFAGEESAGASLLRRDGSVWTTDKDGLALGLLAAEIKARSGRDPGQIYDGLTREFGESWYERIDAPATPQQMDVLRDVSADQIRAKELAGEPIESKADRCARRVAPRSAESRFPPQAAGSRRARPAPRRCTRSMRRAFAAPTICARFSATPRRSSGASSAKKKPRPPTAARRQSSARRTSGVDQAVRSRTAPHRSF